MSEKTSKATWVIGGFFAFVVGSCVLRTPSTSSSPSNANLTPTSLVTTDHDGVKTTSAPASTHSQATVDTRTASWACRKGVTQQLHDPESAQWTAPWSTEAVPGKKKDTFRIQVQVRAKNLYGALAKSTFECDVSRSKDNYNVTRITPIN